MESLGTELVKCRISPLRDSVPAATATTKSARPYRFQRISARRRTPRSEYRAVPTTNAPADRLKRLERAGILTRAPYQESPVRYAYTLTNNGDELREILGACVRWGKKHIPGTLTLSEAGRVASSPRKRKPVRP